MLNNESKTISSLIDTMKILLIQLSDIHINSTEDPIFKKIEHLGRSIRSISFEISAFIFVVTGDIAKYGFPEQYEAATIFFARIKEILSETDLPIYFVAVPGNHDCDLKNNQEELDIRDGLLSILPSKIDSLAKADGKIEPCVKVQDSFFDFLNTQESLGKIEKGNRLFYQRVIEIDGYTLRFDCYNTSWMSVIKEHQGHLYFPVKIAEEQINPEDGDFVIGLFHHPYNWLEANNAREFRRLLERTADFVMTGHEHSDEHFLKRMETDAEVTYLAGDVLQEHGIDSSGFNAILVNLKSQQLKIMNYSWDDSENGYRQRKLFSPTTIQEWKPFQRNLSRISKGFFNTSKFAEWLDEIGIVFFHPFKKNSLKLSDLFVYPNLRSLQENKQVDNKVIKSDNLLNEIRKKQFCLIFGEEHSGKTALAKRIYLDTQQDVIPFYLDISESLKKPDEDSFRQLLNSKFPSQYPQHLIEDFWQLSPQERVLVVDNLQNIGLNKSGLLQLLLLWKRMFSQVYVLADEVFQMQFFLISETDASESEALDYALYDILPANRLIRGRLIKRWTRIGREYQIEEAEFLREEQERERVINPIFDNRVFPSYPFWVISVLQLSSATQFEGNATGASYGYIHNELITKQLRETGYPSDEIGKTYTVLGRIAYSIYKKESPVFDISEFSEISREYSERYGVRLDREDLSKLLKAHIFKADNGSYRFTYPYLYYFFVAQFYAEKFTAGLGNEELKIEIFDMIKTVSYEPHFQILLFFIHFTKSHPFCEKIVEEAHKIYEKIPLCPLDKSTLEFFNNYGFPESKRPVLPEPDTDGNREKFREMLDEKDNSEEEIHPEIIKHNGGLIVYDEQLDDLTKLTIALRNIELLGEILRNFWGSFEIELKTGIATENYSLGLRIMNVLLSISREHSQDFVDHYAQLLKKEDHFRSEYEIKQESRTFLIWTVNRTVFGLIRKIATSVGHRQLGSIYRQVMKSLGASVAVKLIDLSIRLEYESEIGALYPDIEKLHREFTGDNFNFAILRDIVWLHMYLHPVKERDRQKIQALFEIKSSPKLLMNPDKLLKS